MYTLQNKYELGPWESWIIRPKIIHSPGVEREGYVKLEIHFRAYKAMVKKIVYERGRE